MADDRKMSLREYKNMCQAQRGARTVNDSLLKTIERAAGGRDLSKKDFDQIQGKIKLSQTGQDA